jgi:hypothetical protein
MARKQPNLSVAVAKLDLAPAKCSVRMKYRWSLARILKAEDEYRSALDLIRCGKLQSVVLSPDADLLSHEHILDTERYQADCQKLFNGYLHHYQWAGRFGSVDEDEQVKRYRNSQASILAVGKRLSKAGR